MKNRRADEEKTTELGDEQQHRPEREGGRQGEEENGEKSPSPNNLSQSNVAVVNDDI